jgi:hypothetical protein
VYGRARSERRFRTRGAAEGRGLARLGFGLFPDRRFPPPGSPSSGRPKSEQRHQAR